MTNLNQSKAKKMVAQMDSGNDQEAETAFKHVRTYLALNNMSFSGLLGQETLQTEEILRVLAAKESVEKSYLDLERKWKTQAETIVKLRIEKADLVTELSKGRSERVKRYLKIGAISAVVSAFATAALGHWAEGNPSPAIAQTQSIRNDNKIYAVVQESSVPVHSAPSKTAPTLTQLAQSSCVEVTGYAAGKFNWLAAHYKAANGEVRNGYINASRLAPAEKPEKCIAVELSHQ